MLPKRLLILCKAVCRIPQCCCLCALLVTFVQVNSSTLAFHLWPPEGVPEPPPPTESVADAPEELIAAAISKKQLLILSPGNAMLLSPDRKVHLDHYGIPIPFTFLCTCFSPPITSSTQVTAHVVIRTQDVARLPPDAAAVAHKQSATPGFSQLPPFVCTLSIGGRAGQHRADVAPHLTYFAQNLHAFPSWSNYKLQAVSAGHSFHLGYLVPLSNSLGARVAEAPQWLTPLAI